MSGNDATVSLLRRTPTQPAEPPGDRKDRLSTPAKLRIWAIGLTIGALLLLAITSTGITRLSHQIAAIGEHDAPQAATASDIYFALSDLDAQAASLLMLGNSDALSTNQLVSLRTFEQRDAEVDLDLQQAELATTNATERTELSRLAAALTLYRDWLGMAFAVQQEQATQPAGHPPASSLGYYAQATTVLRTRLLPLAASLRQANESDLDASFAAERTSASWAIGSTLLGGLALAIALVAFQRRLARSHHRMVNPSLVLATLCTATLVISSSLLFGAETGSLRRAQQRDIEPYLALTQAQAVSYDAAGDASRYLIESDPLLVADEFATKAKCLRSGGTCDPSARTTVLPTGGLAGITGSSSDAVAQWNAYEADYARVVELANAGQPDQAINVLTGLSAGNGAIDLYRYNRTVDTITAAHRSAYGRQLLDARRTLRFWPEIPATLMIAAIVLIGLGVRPRLNEYR